MQRSQLLSGVSLCIRRRRGSDSLWQRQVRRLFGVRFIVVKNDAPLGWLRSGTLCQRCRSLSRVQCQARLLLLLRSGHPSCWRVRRLRWLVCQHVPDDSSPRAVCLDCSRRWRRRRPLRVAIPRAAVRRHGRVHVCCCVGESVERCASAKGQACERKVVRRCESESCSGVIAVQQRRHSERVEDRVASRRSAVSGRQLRRRIGSDPCGGRRRMDPVFPGDSSRRAAAHSGSRASQWTRLKQRLTD